MDLRDDEGLLSNGRVWLQADDIDLKPWLGKWMQDQYCAGNGTVLP